MIVALYSPAPRSGKTTVADYLNMRHNFRRVRFAGPLKAMASTLLREMGFPDCDVHGMVEGELKDAPVPGFAFRPRDVMQTLGTDWGREAIEKDLWVDIARRKILGLTQSNHAVVVDDLRFPNEYRMLREMHALMVRVVRPSVTMGDRGYEGMLDDLHWDVTIVNDGTTDDLFDAIDYFLKQGGA